MSEQATKPCCTRAEFPLRVELAEYSAGYYVGDRVNGRALLKTSWDAICITSNTTHSEFRRMLRARVKRRTKADTTKWPYGKDAGTAAGNYQIMWDGCAVVVREDYWPAVRLHLQERRPAIYAWFVVQDNHNAKDAVPVPLSKGGIEGKQELEDAVPQKDVELTEVLRDTPPPYEARKGTQGAVASLRRLIKGRK